MKFCSEEVYSSYVRNPVWLCCCFVLFNIYGDASENTSRNDNQAEIPNRGSSKKFLQQKFKLIHQGVLL